MLEISALSRMLFMLYDTMEKLARLHFGRLTRNIALLALHQVS